MRTSAILVTAATALALAACGKPRPPKPPTPMNEEPEAAPAPAPTAEADAPPPPSDLKTVLASTVLVATKWGHGTGVFVDASGLVLTNHHVVASGKNQEYGIEATVTLAEIGEDGSVTPGEQLAATAYKVDPDRDLALLRIDEPGDRSFPFVHVSPGNPSPGSKVASIGNAGVGFGWAVKRCAVNAVGNMESFASVIFQKQRAEGEDPMAEELRKTVAEQAAKQGKQIQSDCNVLPGDSGGPLVDDENHHLVGLNVAIRSATSGWATLGSVAFHIHVGEIRDFLAEIPDNPKLFVPDPWDAAGSSGHFADYNQDGEIDTLRFEGFCADMLRCVATFTDIDQSTFRKSKTSVPPVTKVHEERSFDAELAVVELARYPREDSGAIRLPVTDHLVFVDRNGDKTFDRLLVRDGESGETRGYSLQGEDAERIAEMDGMKLDQVPTLFEPKVLKKRHKLVIAAVADEKLEVRNPARARAIAARTTDGDGDGKLDTVLAETRLDRRLIVDLRQAELEKFRTALERKFSRGQPPGSIGAVVDKRVLGRMRRGSIRGDFLAVLTTPARVFYDTDGRGGYDLVLEGESLEAGVAIAAFTITSDGSRVPANEHVGRKLLRPGLIADAELAKRLDVVLAAALPASSRAAVDDGVSSFPMFDPAATVAAQEVPNSDRALLAVLERAGLTVLGDLDKNTFKGKRRKLDALDAVRKGKFDAEFALRQIRGLTWAFYDRNNDGAFDLVLVSNPARPSSVGAAFEVGKTGALSPSEALVGGPLMRSDLFASKKIAAAFDEMQSRLIGAAR